MPTRSNLAMSAADNTRPSTLSPRVAAVNALQAVLDGGRSMNEAAPQDSLAKAMTFGVLRWLPVLNQLLKCYLEKPLRAKDRPVELVLLVGLYQLGWMEVAAHAAINETVLAAQQLRRSWAKGLVNAVLRQYQRDQCPTQVADTIAMQAHPHWLSNRIRQAWPEQADQIIAQNNRQAPMWLRVNQQLSDGQIYRQELEALGLAAQVSIESDTALRLDQACDIKTLPGFAQGHVSVQDIAAQLTTSFFRPGQDLRVLDACAAPGGKACHMLERGLGEVTALDVDAARLARVKDNFSRLRLRGTLEARDARDLPASHFDRILLDVPCSATGVIRRHPDIKWLRRDSDIADLVKIQRELIRSAWLALRPGGQLLYSTCSILPTENKDQIVWFCDAEPEASLVDLQMAYGFDTGYGWQRFPGDGDGDGFFYALLGKPN